MARTRRAVTLFTTLALLSLFAGAGRNASAQSTHAAGSSGTPPIKVPVERADPDFTALHNAASWMLPSGYQIGRHDRRVRGMLESYAWMMTSSGREARVGITNCDSPYFSAVTHNMQWEVRQMERLTNHLAHMIDKIGRAITRLSPRLRSAIRQLSPSSPGAAAAGAAAELVGGPIVTGINVMTGESDAADLRDLVRVEGRLTELEQWYLALHDLHDRASELTEKGTEDLARVRDGFLADACTECRRDARPDPPAPEGGFPELTGNAVPDGEQIIDQAEAGIEAEIDRAVAGLR